MRVEVHTKALIGIIHVHIATMPGPTEQPTVRRVPVEISIIGADRQEGEKLDIHQPLDAIEARLAEILSAHAEGRIRRVGSGPCADQIAHLSVKKSCRQLYTVAENSLFDSRVQLPAFLRAQIRIAESSAAETRREKQFIQGGGFESFGITGLELGAGLAKKIGGGNRRTPFGTESLVVIQANPGNHDEPIA